MPVLKALLYIEELEIRAFLCSALPTQYLLCCNTHCLFLRLLGFGETYLQGFTHKIFSLSDSITNRKMAKPDTARTQPPNFQHGG